MKPLWEVNSHNTDVSSFLINGKLHRFLKWSFDRIKGNEFTPDLIVFYGLDRDTSQVLCWVFDNNYIITTWMAPDGLGLDASILPQDPSKLVAAIVLIENVKPEPEDLEWKMRADWRHRYVKIGPQFTAT